MSDLAACDTPCPQNSPQYRTDDRAIFMPLCLPVPERELVVARAYHDPRVDEVGAASDRG